MSPRPSRAVGGEGDEDGDTDGRQKNGAICDAGEEEKGAEDEARGHPGHNHRVGKTKLFVQAHVVGNGAHFPA